MHAYMCLRNEIIYKYMCVCASVCGDKNRTELNGWLNHKIKNNGKICGRSKFSSGLIMVALGDNIYVCIMCAYSIIFE